MKLSELPGQEVRILVTHPGPMPEGGPQYEGVYRATVKDVRVQGSVWLIQFTHLYAAKRHGAGWVINAWRHAEARPLRMELRVTEGRMLIGITSDTRIVVIDNDEMWNDMPVLKDQLIAPLW